MERESEDKDNEIESANREIDKLGRQIYTLEEENEALKEELQRAGMDFADERDRLEKLAGSPKEVNSRHSRVVLSC